MIVGVVTNNAVESTARVAGDLGFDTVLVRDATFTFGRNDDRGIFRTAEDVHAMSLENLDVQSARVVTPVALSSLSDRLDLTGAAV